MRYATPFSLMGIPATTPENNYKLGNAVTFAFMLTLPWEFSVTQLVTYGNVT
ncbi:hypothetical protein ACTQ5H_07735 [Limosilactobacillus reuteri]|uniref:hypothetical protein n=1 Tax=Lactobacillaceae TaxID=33958 RepID=UPI00146C4355|nr:hypothetical protein [Lactobacillus sp. MRS-253-APC-2B]NME33747.1 hypothetical protein [Lactobacillus sp. MRS-253-APC-2B]